MRKRRGHIDPRRSLSEDEGTVLVLPFLTCVKRFNYPFMEHLAPPYLPLAVEWLDVSTGVVTVLGRGRLIAHGQRDVVDTEGTAENCRHERLVELHELIDGHRILGLRPMSAIDLLSHVASFLAKPRATRNSLVDEMLLDE
jgi:hypothetical protein